MNGFKALIEGYAQPGVVAEILLRPERLKTPFNVQAADVSEDGVIGDHGRPGKRAVTLIQAEHLSVIGVMLGRDPIDAHVLRRNFVVSGLNLNALKGRQVQIGKAVLEVTGMCAPCSRMETALGKGGYSAMRGHGGWCAAVLQAGPVSVGDEVWPLPVLSNSDGAK